MGGVTSDTITVGWLDDQGAVDHVHPTGEAKLPAPIRGELDRGLREGRQGMTDGKIGKYDPRGAVPALLAVEHGGRDGRS
jgi:hypothetical protein